MDFFLSDVEQQMIMDILNARKNEVYKQLERTVDFDGDGKADVILDAKRFNIKDLFVATGAFSNGNNITINPDTLNILADNLKLMSTDDIAWIKDTVKKCIQKNNDLKASKDLREDRLNDEILEGLKEASLIKLLNSIDESHGELTKRSNISVLESLITYNTYNVTRKFDMWGSSGNRKWYLDSERLKVSDLKSWINSIKECSRSLKYELTRPDQITYYDRYDCKETTLNYNTVSVIGEALVNVSNDFISKAEEVFNGTGLRSGKNDGIVNALEEVFDVELKNIDELGQVILNISDMAAAIANNFEKADKAVSNYIESGNSPYLQADRIPSSYDAYLKENSIFDDVKDVIQAFDLQVEEACDELAQKIVNSYVPILDRTHDNLRETSSKFQEFNNSIDEFYDKLDGQLKSKKYVYKPSESKNSSSYSPDYNSNDYEIQEESYGTLKNYLPYEIVSSYEGQTFNKYSEQLNKVQKLLTYFVQMLDDCFGTKM